jgi:hypothetical protein
VKEEIFWVWMATGPYPLGHESLRDGGRSQKDAI